MSGIVEIIGFVAIVLGALCIASQASWFGFLIKTTMAYVLGIALIGLGILLIATA